MLHELCSLCFVSVYAETRAATKWCSELCSTAWLEVTSWVNLDNQHADDLIDTTGRARISIEDVCPTRRVRELLQRQHMCSRPSVYQSCLSARQLHEAIADLMLAEPQLRIKLSEANHQTKNWNAAVEFVSGAVPIWTVTATRQKAKVDRVHRGQCAVHAEPEPARVQPRRHVSAHRDTDRRPHQAACA